MNYWLGFSKMWKSKLQWNDFCKEERNSYWLTYIENKSLYSAQWDEVIC